MLLSCEGVAGSKNLIFGENPPTPVFKPGAKIPLSTVVSKISNLLSDIYNKQIAEQNSYASIAPEPQEPIVIDRATPVVGISSEFVADGNSEIANLITVTKAPPDTKNTLEDAYQALLLGHIETAVHIYKEILEREPNNRLAMFGYATSYHKNKQHDQALEAYEKVLEKYPDYTEAFNNFLILLGDEYPEQAIAELKELEVQNPKYAPIQAQLGVLYRKIGNKNRSVYHLKKAATISPRNIQYKYNLAVALDEIGKSRDAMIIYKQLIKADTSIDNELGERVAYLESIYTNPTKIHITK